MALAGAELIALVNAGKHNNSKPLVQTKRLFSQNPFMRPVVTVATVPTRSRDSYCYWQCRTIHQYGTEYGTLVDTTDTRCDDGLSLVDWPAEPI